MSPRHSAKRRDGGVAAGGTGRTFRRRLEAVMDSMSPEPLPRPIPGQTAETGPWGGPSYRYRGARIECMQVAHVCGLCMEDHPLDGRSFGVLGTVTPCVDLWIDEGGLPSCMRAVPKPGQ
jgi:hypothetical protein